MHVRIQQRMYASAAYVYVCNVSNECAREQSQHHRSPPHCSQRETTTRNCNGTEQTKCIARRVRVCVFVCVYDYSRVANLGSMHVVNACSYTVCVCVGCCVANTPPCAASSNALQQHQQSSHEAAMHEHPMLTLICIKFSIHSYARVQSTSDAAKHVCCTCVYSFVCVCGHYNVFANCERSLSVRVNRAASS